MTNNEAEYCAVKTALEWLVEYLEQEPSRCQNCQAINFFLDSKLVVCQLTGQWKIKDFKMRLLCGECQTLLNKIPVKYCFTHIPREKNKTADALVNQALDQYQADVKNRLK